MPDALRAARRRWAELLRRIFEVDPLRCPRCGQEMRIVAVITEPPVIDRILTYLHRTATAPRRGAGCLPTPSRRRQFGRGDFDQHPGINRRCTVASTGWTSSAARDRRAPVERGGAAASAATNRDAVRRYLTCVPAKESVRTLRSVCGHIPTIDGDCCNDGRYSLPLWAGPYAIKRVALPATRPHRRPATSSHHVPATPEINCRCRAAARDRFSS